MVQKRREKKKWMRAVNCLTEPLFLAQTDVSMVLEAIGVMTAEIAADGVVAAAVGEEGRVRMRDFVPIRASEIQSMMWQE